MRHIDQEFVYRKACKKCGNECWTVRLDVDTFDQYYECTCCDHRIKKDTRRKKTIAQKALELNTKVTNFFEEAGIERFDFNNHWKLGCLSTWMSDVLSKGVNNKRVTNSELRVIEDQLKECEDLFLNK